MVTMPYKQYKKVLEVLYIKVQHQLDSVFTQQIQSM